METSDIDYSVGPGWEHIVAPLMAYCRAYKHKVLQVKEKMGGLRFYYRTTDNPEGFCGDATFDRLVTAAELQADKTCEWCGGPGKKVQPLYWIKTLCPTCAERWKVGKRWFLAEDGKHA